MTADWAGPPAGRMKARIRKEGGRWEWDARDERLLGGRSTGCELTWHRAIERALGELAWMAGRPAPKAAI